jgi:alkanesulfonate monooxygenase
VPARDLAAAEADVLFLNGQSGAEAAALIEDVRRRPRPGLAPLRFGLAAFVVTAPTEREADDMLEYHWMLNARDKADDGDTIDRFSRDTDPGSVMWQRLRARPHIGPNGGTAAGLVGDYDTVARRIVDWHRGGIETFMLAFQPFEAEMERFATHIVPRVHRLLQTAEVAS